jgi:hypothetical protein
MKKYIVTFYYLLFCFTYLIAATTTTTIEFSGITWDVKSGSSLAPGPNNWTSNSKYVFVDPDGYLHLPIKYIAGKWYCSELISQKSFGYGEYKVVLGTNVETLDKNIIVGIFTYETDKREIDIEFSRWGNPSNVAGWYTVQPVNSSSQRSFSLNLNSVFSTHKFVWTNNNIAFDSFQGDNDLLPSTSIENWVYTGIQNPPAGNERFHLNFWLFQGKAPTNGLDAELIVKSVSILNNTFNEIITPTSMNSLGAQWNIDDGVWLNSDTKVYVSTGNHVIKFKDIPGYNTPINKNIIIQPNTDLIDTTSYMMPTSVEKVLSAHFSVYPNPCKDKLTITSNLLNQNLKFSIMDIRGKILYTKSIILYNDSPINFEISDLINGIYLLKIQSPTATYMRRFIKE